jgi:ElaB/YqjD/DUF883 family membrane-anchored ribosome-binding protein
LQKRWHQLSDDVFQQNPGNVKDLVNVIQRKTGENHEAVEKYLEEVTDQAHSFFNSVNESAKEYTQKAADTWENTNRKACDRLRNCYAQTEDLIHNRPLQSLGVSFGFGVGVGVLFYLLMRSK